MVYNPFNWATNIVQAFRFFAYLRQQDRYYNMHVIGRQKLHMIAIKVRWEDFKPEVLKGFQRIEGLKGYVGMLYNLVVTYKPEAKYMAASLVSRFDDVAQAAKHTQVHGIALHKYTHQKNGIGLQENRRSDITAQKNVDS